MARRDVYLDSGFELSYPLQIELDFDEEKTIDWMSENWTISFWLSAVYVAVIFGIQWIMKDRTRFDLRPLLALWSGTLALCSIFVAVRVAPELYHAIVVHGWQFTVCSPSCYFGHTALYAFLLAVSKAYELGDTLFIVLRKQPLIFLHWYHHVTVMIYSFYTYANFYAPGRWFAIINVVVHAFMYTYYFLRAIKIRLPRWINISLTTMQTSQMVFGIIVNVSAYRALQRGESCHVTYDNIKYSLMMYATYFVLFAHYFYVTYVASKSKAKPAQEKPVMNGKHHMNGNGYIHVSTDLNANGTYHKKAD